MAASTGHVQPILHVTTVHGPLDTRIYYKEVLSLARAGYPVRLATTIDREEIHQGVALLPLGSREGSRWRRIVRDVRAMALMLRERSAIVHIHDPELLLFAVVPALLRRKLVFDVHEFYLERIAVSHWIPALLRKPIMKAYDALERFVLRRFCGIVIVSEAMRQRYASIVPNERVALVRNFPYISASEAQGARARAHPLQGSPYIIHTGGAMYLRAFHTLIEAAEYLRAHNCDWPVLNLGPIDLSAYDSATRNDLISRARAADVRNLGLLDQLEAWRYVAHADIAYMPLVPEPNNVRGMPNKLFEYLLFGLPIVATDMGQVAEILTQTQAGMLVPAEDGAAHGLALGLLATDAALRAAYRERSREASDRFTFPGEFARLKELYARIAGSA